MRVVGEHGLRHRLSLSQGQFNGQRMGEIGAKATWFGVGERYPHQGLLAPGPDQRGRAVMTVRDLDAASLHLKSRERRRFVSRAQPGQVLFDEPGIDLREPAPLTGERVTAWKDEVSDGVAAELPQTIKAVNAPGAPSCGRDNGWHRFQPAAAHGILVEIGFAVRVWAFIWQAGHGKSRGIWDEISAPQLPGFVHRALLLPGTTFAL